jgi:hypothetical protein
MGESDSIRAARAALEAEKARVLKEAAERAAAIEREMAELESLSALASRYNYALTPIGGEPTRPQAQTQPAADTQPAVNTRHPVNTQPAVNTRHPVNTQPAVNTRHPVNTRPAVNTRHPVKTRPAVTMQPAANTKPEAKTAPLMLDGTLKSLCRRYCTDERSPYRKLKYKSRKHYNVLIGRIDSEVGHERLFDLKARHIQSWHDRWTIGGKYHMAHSLVTMLRGLVNFGALVLEDKECERLSVVLHNMRFTKVQSTKNEPLTYHQATAIIAKAHELGLPSIALAQAFQFGCGLKQIDVIGQWVPVDEPGESDVVKGGTKWLGGLKWSEIGDDLVLRHSTVGNGKLIEARLSDAKLVMAELDLVGSLRRTGPVIVSESTGLPYITYSFRRDWRRVADAAGVPKNVKNGGSLSDDDPSHADVDDRSRSGG